MVHAANDRGNMLLDDVKDESKDKSAGSGLPMNVILLKNEVDLEWNSKKLPTGAAHGVTKI